MLLRIAMQEKNIFYCFSYVLNSDLNFFLITLYIFKQEDVKRCQKMPKKNLKKEALEKSSLEVIFDVENPRKIIQFFCFEMFIKLN